MKKNKGLTSKQMSKVHWQLRKKGKTYKQALKITGRAKVLSKKYGNKKLFPGKMRGPLAYIDLDGDKKVSRYDCYPFDKKRQDDYSGFDPVGKDKGGEMPDYEDEGYLPEYDTGYSRKRKEAENEEAVNYIGEKTKEQEEKERQFILNKMRERQSNNVKLQRLYHTGAYDKLPNEYKEEGRGEYQVDEMKKKELPNWHSLAKWDSSSSKMEEEKEKWKRTRDGYNVGYPRFSDEEMKEKRALRNAQEMMKTFNIKSRETEKVNDYILAKNKIKRIGYKDQELLMRDYEERRKSIGRGKYGGAMMTNFTKTNRPRQRWKVIYEDGQGANWDII